MTFGLITIPAADVPCHEIESFYTWDDLKGINLDITMLFIDGMLYFLLIVMIETRLLYKVLEMAKNWMPGYYKYKVVDTQADLDDDVSEEQKRVATNIQPQTDVLKVFGLKKKFRHLAAVKDVSFGVKTGECFGLLGINGAGKTTTFRMLTGDETPSTGEAEILSTNLGSARRKFLSQVQTFFFTFSSLIIFAQIGYCPQFDSIIPELTGRELLSLMARVRGVQLDRVAEEVDRWTQFLGIQEYIDRASGSYSGGNKRKLNVAMSLVAEPPVIFLDEPSTGVDPVARRNLWRIIQRIQAAGQSVILTSHSMEECEALCDRLAIMVNGQFQCFGSVPHLKNKFALGFTILTKLKLGASEDADDSQIASLKDFVSSNLPNVEVKDEHKGYIHFHVQSPVTPWSTLFRVMEDAKTEMTPFLEEYSISQTTLEQVFLNFAKKQSSL